MGAGPLTDTADALQGLNLNERDGDSDYEFIDAVDDDGAAVTRPCYLRNRPY